MSAEFPKITPMHAKFHREVGSLAGAMTDYALEASNTHLGQPPTERCAEFLRGYLAGDLDFSSTSLRDASRITPGSIAGSDSLSISDIILPNETGAGNYDDEAYQARSFPGRIVNFLLHYGVPPRQSQEYTLFTGPGAPPIIYDYEAAMALPKVDEHSINFAGNLQDRLPANKQHYPDEQELKTLLRTLKQARDDITLSHAFDALLQDLEDGEPLPEELDWVYPRLDHLARKVINLEQLAQRPFIKPDSRG